jgi:transcription elongation factor GreA
MNIPRNLLAKTPKRKFYLTKQGLGKIKKEMENLKVIKLSKISGETPHFFHSDDLDPEYLNFQDDLTSLETRLADLEYIIENSEIIKPPKKDKQNIIQIGAKVLVEINGQEDEITILGTLEANPYLGIISNESPVGQALLGHKEGEEVVISSPIKTTYKIKKIDYS